MIEGGYTQWEKNEGRKPSEGNALKPAVACPEASHIASQKESHSPALKRSGTHRTSLSLLSVLLCYDVFSSNRGHRISKGRERD